MSRDDGRESDGRRKFLQELHQAGRQMSDAIVLFHGAISEALGLVPSDWKTLSLLEQNGPLGAGDLVRLTGMAPASVTGILDRLEGDGWITRRPDPADRRRVLVALDPEGRARHFAVAFAPLMDRLANIYDRLGDEELRLLSAIFRDIAEAQRAATSEVVAGIAEVAGSGGRSSIRRKRRD